MKYRILETRGSLLTIRMMIKTVIKRKRGRGQGGQGILNLRGIQDLSLSLQGSQGRADKETMIQTKMNKMMKKRNKQGRESNQHLNLTRNLSLNLKCSLRRNKRDSLLQNRLIKNPR